MASYSIFVVHEGTGTWLDIDECTLLVVKKDNDIAMDALYDDDFVQATQFADKIIPPNDVHKLVKNNRF